MRRGTVALWAALTLPAVAAIGAIVIDLGYAWCARQQIQNTVDAAALAAVMELDGTDAGLAGAVAQAQSIAAMNEVVGAAVVLADDDVITGEWDPDALAFTATTDAARADAVRVVGGVDGIGLGFARIAFGSDGMSVSARATAVRGPGDASTGDEGGPGLQNGHFDFDTHNAISPIDSGTTTTHTHEFDDSYDVTSVDALDIWQQKKHLDVDEALASTQRFRIIVANSNLSPGAWLTLNGVDYDVLDYADIPVGSLTIWSFAGVSGSTRLTEFSINFDVEAIASCELHPTVTGSVRKNVLGPNQEWRNGALTFQAIKVNAGGTPAYTLNTARANGGQGVASSGLGWESTFFWHWDGPAYHESGWEDAFAELRCSTPRIVE